MRITGKIERTMKVRRSPKVLQLEGKYDLAELASETAVWDVDVTLPEAWGVGVIVGASGSGKTTVARFIAEKLGAVLQTPRDEKGVLVEPYVWGADTAVIEDIAGEEGSVEDTMMLLSSVGFASPPAWRRPFNVLSFGQQFRATLARTLGDAIADKRPRMVDEYSSVIDRKVAKIGSAAVAKTVRRYGLQFVAVTCHHDVIDWLEPDWVITCHDDRTVSIELATQETREQARGLTDDKTPARRWVRPRVDVRLSRAFPAAWARFAPHHYLDAELHRSAVPYVATVEGQVAGFVAAVHYPQQKGLTYREHRVVVLPDYQGIGLGNRISEAVAAIYRATGRPYYSVSSHPAMIAHRKRSPLWRMTRPIGTSNGATGLNRRDGKKRRTSRGRLTGAFEFIGPANVRGAQRLGVLRACARAGEDGSATASQRARVG